jgi:hypothetical protein
MLRIDPMLGKVLAFIPGEVIKEKVLVEKNITNNFLVMLLSWLIIKSKNLQEPVVLLDDSDKPAWEIIIKKL